MSDSKQSSKQRIAICAILSLTLLLVGYLFSSVGQVTDIRQGMNRGLLAGFCEGLGLILAVASFLRREKPVVLPWLALVLNLAPYILVLLTNG